MPTRFLSAADAKLVLGTRININLSDHLVRASTNTSQKNIIPPICNRKRTCCYCPNTNTSGTLTSITNGRSFQGMKRVTYQSSNLIYIITCKICGTQYVGQTQNCLLTRFQGHIHDRHVDTCPPDNTKGPVPYTDPTQQLSRVVIILYMGPGITTTVGSVCTTDPSGRES